MSGIIGGGGSRSGVIGETELDYETGTWTPTVSSGTATTLGVYTRIGNIVTVSAYMKAFSDHTSTASINITQLPFTSAATGFAQIGTLLTSYFTHYGEAVTVINTSSSNMVIWHSNSEGDYFNLKHQAIASASTSVRLFTTITYMTA